jgi:hypothetical protein
MGIAERSYEVVKGLPEAAAAEVLDAEAKRSRAAADAVDRIQDRIKRLKEILR